MRTRSRLSVQVGSRYYFPRRFLNGVVYLSPLNRQIDMLCSVALILSVASSCELSSPQLSSVPLDHSLLFCL